MSTRFFISGYASLTATPYKRAADGVTYHGMEAGKMRVYDFAFKLWNANAWGDTATEAGLEEAAGKLTDYVRAQVINGNLDSIYTAEEIISRIVNGIPVEYDWYGGGAASADSTTAALSKRIANLSNLAFAEAVLIIADAKKDARAAALPAIRYQQQFAAETNSTDQPVILSPSQQEFYRRRAGDGRYTNYADQYSDTQINEKVNTKSGVKYGPENYMEKYDFPWSYYDGKTNSFLSNDLGGYSLSPRAVALHDMYVNYRNSGQFLFVKQQQGIDYESVPDYSALFKQYLGEVPQPTTEQNGNKTPIELYPTTPTSATYRQNTAMIVSAIIALYDEMEAYREQNGGYDPYQFLAFYEFMNSILNGDLADVIGYEAPAYIQSELENHKKGKHLGKEIAEANGFVKWLAGVGLNAGTSMLDIGNLPQVLKGDMIAKPYTDTASDMVLGTFDTKAGQLLYKAGGALGSTLPYMVAGAVGGSYMGMATMAAQTLSDTSAQAMRDGYDSNEALVYGMASAALEVAVSKLIGSSSQGIGRSLLGTKATNLLSKALNAVSTLPWSKSVLQAIGTRLINAAGEAAEEYLQACFDPLIRNMILDENNEISFVDEEKVENALIGALLALLLPVDSSQDTTSVSDVETPSVQDISPLDLPSIEAPSLNLPSVSPLNIPSTSSTQDFSANESGIEGEFEKPFEKRQQSIQPDPEVTELTEAFKAGAEGRQYVPESQESTGKVDNQNAQRYNNGGASDMQAEEQLLSESAKTSIQRRQHIKGYPNAILQFGVELNVRQDNILNKLQEYDSKTVLRKSSVSMKDLAALTARTGDEFAMFTKGGEALVIRGDAVSVNVTEESAIMMAKQGYRWSGHTHPGIDSFSSLQPSLGDYLILSCFEQEYSVIYNSKGEYRIFSKWGVVL